MLAMNNSMSQATKKTAYEMVFGQALRIDHDFWQEIHKQSKNCSVINEEEINESILTDFNLFNEPVRRRRRKKHCLCQYCFFFIVKHEILGPLSHQEVRRMGVNIRWTFSPPNGRT